VWTGGAAGGRALGGGKGEEGIAPTGWIGVTQRSVEWRRGSSLLNPPATMLATQCAARACATQAAAAPRRTAGVRAAVQPRARQQLRARLPKHTVHHRGTPARPSAVAVESEAATAEKQTQRVPHDEMARSIVHLARSGTLATVMEDGWPLATQMKYVLDSQGRPVLKLRVDAIHTQNLSREARCSLYVRSSSGARASMLGTVEPLEGEGADALIAEYAAVHGDNAFGVDALAADDRYVTLAVQKIFFVEGLGADKTAAEVSGAFPSNRNCTPFSPQITPHTPTLKPPPRPPHQPLRPTSRDQVGTRHCSTRWALTCARHTRHLRYVLTRCMCRHTRCCGLRRQRARAAIARCELVRMRVRWRYHRHWTLLRLLPQLAHRAVAQRRWSG
jgi:hypothetical protein